MGRRGCAELEWVDLLNELEPLEVTTDAWIARMAMVKMRMEGSG
jgi:hypothetical protein